MTTSAPTEGASLFFGRNEEEELRCVYHGWKYDVQGRCLDMPSEPPESNSKDKIRATAYPCQEPGGIVWAYMGPRPEPPPLPDLEPNMQAEGQGSVWAANGDRRQAIGIALPVRMLDLGSPYAGEWEPCLYGDLRSTAWGGICAWVADVASSDD